MNLFKKIELGPLKNLDDITIDDMKKYPIWINDLSGELEDNYDETAERPVINGNEVTKKMLSKFMSVNILIHCEELNLYGSANVEEDCSLSTLVFWKNNKWQNNNKFIKNKTIEITSIPTLIKKDNLKYKYDIGSDQGNIIS